MKSVSLLSLFAGLLFASNVFAGTGRVFLECKDGTSIDQSEQSLGWPEKPGTPGIHDEYIFLHGTKESMTNGRFFQGYLGYRIENGILTAKFRELVNATEFRYAEVKMPADLTTPGETAEVTFNYDGEIVKTNCTSTIYLSRILLRALK